MEYKDCLAVMYRSGLETLEILAKQADKDFGKVYEFGYGVYTVLSSDTAKQKYRIAAEVTGRIIEILVLVVIALASELERFVVKHEKPVPVVEDKVVEAVPVVKAVSKPKKRNKARVNKTAVAVG